jgi:quinol monooxygenase YgiN
MKTLRSVIIAALCAMTVSAAPVLSQPASADRAATSAKVGLFVRLDAKPGKEEDVARFLIGGRPIVDQEPGTSTWFAIRLTPTTFAIFDTFPDDSGRAAHLSGKVAAALMAQAPDMLAHPPVIEKIDVLAVKIPTAFASK